MCKTFYNKTAKELLTIQWVSENNSNFFNLENKPHLYYLIRLTPVIR